MTSERIGRRGFLTIGAGLLLTSCATSYGDNPAIPVIRRVQVSGSGNLWLQRMPPYLQRNLVRQLGSRYQPGAKGGATLSVVLTDISFPVDSDGGLVSFDSVDTLDGRITLSSSGSVIKSFPLFATTTSVDAAAEVPDPTPRRYDWLASSYAHWLLSKLVQA
ncbi:hypothetical protein AB4037_17020 [Labrys sp. KB_33_2]|uniref:hypothetical protein n=1 Tax=Labrys sp. KB_33_2 TaxID=3237479 RepID=UPI003F8F8E4D